MVLWSCLNLRPREMGLPSPGQILNHQIEKEIPISVNIFLKSQQNELYLKSWQEVFDWMPFFSAKLRCKSLSFSLGNQMKIQTAESVVHSISYLLVLSLTIITSANHPKDPFHHMIKKKSISLLWTISTVLWIKHWPIVWFCVLPEEFKHLSYSPFVFFSPNH